MVSGVGREMGVLDGVHVGGDALFPNYSGEGLVTKWLRLAIQLLPVQVTYCVEGRAALTSEVSRNDGQESSREGALRRAKDGRTGRR